MKPFDPAECWEEDDAIAQRAADYFEQRRFGAWSDAEQAELDAWFAESTLHRVAYLRVEGIFAHTRRLAKFRPFDARRGASVGRVLDRRILIPLLAAASIALVATFAVPFVRQLMTPPDRIFSTDIGGHTIVNFADGTQMVLNTNTLIRVRMTDAERTVWLKRGEAYFRVTHDATHPFSVIAGNHRVSDLGTEFSVRRSADGVEVALLSGRAALSNEGAQSATLTPGDDAVVTADTLSVIRKTPQQLADELSWRRGVLVFRQTRLIEVVRQLNRYNATKLIVADPSIANVKITAELRTNDFEGFLQLAQVVLNLRVDHEGNDILISRRVDRSPQQRR